MAYAEKTKVPIDRSQAKITTIDQEFLAHIVLPSGQTMGDHAIPQIEQAYALGKMPVLRLGYTGDN